jgi:hypothetical protein
MLTDIKTNQIFCYTHPLNADMGSSIGLKLSTNTVTIITGDGYCYVHSNPSVVFAKPLLL